MNGSRALKTAGRVGGFFARHCLALLVTVAVGCAFWTATYFALLLWAAFAGGGLGSPASYPLGLLLVFIAGTLVGITLFLPCTAIAEWFGRRHGLPALAQIPISVGVFACLCFGIVGIASAFSPRPTVWGVSLGFGALFLALLVPLGLYWWVAQGGPLLLTLLRHFYGTIRALRAPRESGGKTLLRAIAVCPLMASTFASSVTIREDKKLLVDGAPFFPIGLYYAEEEIADESGAALAELRAMGFNTVFFHGGIAQKPALDRIAAAGLRVQFRPPGSLNSQFDELEKTVVALRPHPALLLWEHEDEPVLNKVKFEDSKRGYELMKRLDPDHPVLCIQWPDWRNPSKLGGEPDAPAVLRKWGTICDIYGYDKYPVPLRRWFYQGDEMPPGFPHSIAVMGPLTTWWQELAPTKPVLPVLQAWAWRPVKDGKEGYPTREQSRFMAYQVALRGACGILYYGKIRVSQPHTPSGIPEELSSDPVKLAADFAKAKELNAWFWSYFREVVREISEMSPVFLASDSATQPQIEIVGGGAAQREIELRAKKFRDAEVILLVNGSDKPAELRVTSPAFADRTVHCWREARALSADNAGAFTDRVEPFGVRIFATAPR